MLPPWVLQVFGLAVIAVALVVWIQTGKESLPLVGVGLGLATLGGLGTLAELAKRAYYKGEPGERRPGDPPEDKP